VEGQPLLQLSSWGIPGTLVGLQEATMLGWRLQEVTMLGVEAKRQEVGAAQRKEEGEQPPETIRLAREPQ